MGADEIKEEEKSSDEIIGRGKGRKTLFGFVPSLELLIKALNEVVGNIVLKALNADVPHPREQGFDRNLVS